VDFVGFAGTRLHTQPNHFSQLFFVSALVRVHLHRACLAIMSYFALTYMAMKKGIKISLLRYASALRKSAVSSWVGATGVIVMMST